MRSLLRGSLRAGLAFAVVLAGVVAVSGDAEAKRGKPSRTDSAESSSQRPDAEESAAPARDADTDEKGAGDEPSDTAGATGQDDEKSAEADVSSPGKASGATAGVKVINAPSRTPAAADRGPAPAPATAAAPPASAGASTAPAPAVAESPAEASPKPARAASATIVTPENARSIHDHVVPGCAPGMLCTVCVAGCPKQAGAIIHVEPMVTRKQ